MRRCVRRHEGRSPRGRPCVTRWQPSYRWRRCWGWWRQVPAGPTTCTKPIGFATSRPHADIPVEPRHLPDTTVAPSEKPVQLLATAPVPGLRLPRRAANRSDAPWLSMQPLSLVDPCADGCEDGGVVGSAPTAAARWGAPLRSRSDSRVGQPSSGDTSVGRDAAAGRWAAARSPCASVICRPASHPSSRYDACPHVRGRMATPRPKTLPSTGASCRKGAEERPRPGLMCSLKEAE
jgi:hypothetical protein